MRKKSDAYDKYREFQNKLKMQNCITIQVLHSDRGAEFLATKFQEYLKSYGTVQKLTVHNTPEHNGIAERSH